jgi:hypothetical protein
VFVLYLMLSLSVASSTGTTLVITGVPLLVLWALLSFVTN